MKKILFLPFFLLGLWLSFENVNACYTSFSYKIEPTVTIQIYPPIEVSGGTVVFAGVADSQVESWNWNFGDGTTSYEQNPTHTFLTNGTYVITLTTKSSDCTATYTDSITFPQPENCWIDFDYSTIMTLVDCKCAGFFAFRPFANDSIIAAKWDFGDGSTSSDFSPNHMFVNSGAYTVTLSVTTLSGCNITTSKYLPLGSDTCQITINHTDKDPYTFWINNEIMYSRLPDYKLEWTFGDGITSNEYFPTHTFKESGNYTICATKYSPNGEVCTSCVSEYFNSPITPTDPCNKVGTFYRNYSDCKLPVIITDNQKFALTEDIALNIPDSAKVMFGYVTDSTLQAYTYCANDSFLNIWASCIKDVSPVPDSLCTTYGTYWGKYLDCTYPVIKTDLGAFLVLGGAPENISNGTSILFGYNKIDDKILYTNCIDYFAAVKLTCVTIIDSSAMCQHTGTVVDNSGLDGCGFIIKLDNGEVLEPVSIPLYFQLYNNQRVKLSYKERTDMASTCMMGKIVDITCIEEIEIQPLPECNFWVTVNTSYTTGSNTCNGMANAYVYSPTDSWLRDKCGKMQKCITDPYTYTYLWSTGDTGMNISNLCPNQLYSITVTDKSHTCSVSSSFAFFEIPNWYSAWTYQYVGNQFYFNLPIQSNYNVSWTFDNGTVINGNSISYPKTNGVNSVTLNVTDKDGNNVYTEVIDLSTKTDIEPNEASDIKVVAYPIPAKNEITLSFSSKNSEPAEIEIFDMLGKKTYSAQYQTHKGENTLTVNVSNLLSGVYIGAIKLSDQVLRFKFSK
jgi:hypothetical protein